MSLLLRLIFVYPVTNICDLRKQLMKLPVFNVSVFLCMNNKHIGVEGFYLKVNYL